MSADLLFRRQYVLQYQEPETGQWLDADFERSEPDLRQSLEQAREDDPDVPWRGVIRTTQDTEMTE